MRKDRRNFLQVTGAVALAASAGKSVATAQTATSARASSQGIQQAPKGLTYATIQSSGGYGLGVRTDEACST